MRNTMKFAKIAAILLAIAGTSHAAGPVTKFSTDELWIGKSGSTLDHKYKWDFGLGATNPALSVDNATKTLQYNKNSFFLGDGASSNKTIKADLGLGAANPAISYDTTLGSWAFANDGVNFSTFGSGSGSGSGINLLSNPGFESGVTQDWTNSGGTFAAVSSGSNLLIGLKSATFTASASSQYVQSGLHAIQNGMAGGYCSAGMLYKGGDSNLTFEVRDGSAVLLASKVLAASAGPATFSLPFVCPSSGTVRVKVISSGSAALIAMDQVFLGQSASSMISQASFFGSTESPPTNAGCVWQYTTLTTWGAFPSQAACTAPVNLGQAVTTAKVPQIDFNSLPPGDYMVIATGNMTADSNNGCGYRISDGTTSDGETYTEAVGATQVGFLQNVIGRFSYTTAQGAKTFTVQSFATGTGCTIYNSALSHKKFSMKVYRYPTQDQVASTPDTSAISWSGYHDTDCSWNTTSNSYVTPSADASCTFVEKTNRNFGTVSSTGSKTPGITFTPPKVGMYYVCADALAEGTVDSALATRLWDGTNSLGETTFWNIATYNRLGHLHTCGVFNASSIATASIFVQMQTSAGTMTMYGADVVNIPPVQWSIFALDQSFPAPVMAGSVTSPSGGVEVTIRASVALSGASCTISSQSSGFTAASRTAAGRCQLTMAAGFASPPSCVVSVDQASLGDQIVAFIAGDTARSATNVHVGIADTGGVAVDQPFNIICMGPK